MHLVCYMNNFDNETHYKGESVRVKRVESVWVKREKMDEGSEYSIVQQPGVTFSHKVVTMVNHHGLCKKIEHRVI